MGLYCYNYNNATWENEPLKQILRRGLRANAFDRTADTLHATVSSATRAADECDGILIDSGDDQEPSSITLSSPINLPSPIAPIDERRDKVMDEPHLNAACQVDNDMVSPDTSTTSISPPPPPPPPPSPPTSSPPPPPQEPFEVISENKAKEEPGSEAKEVTEIVGEDNKSQTKVSASDALDENTGILPLPPPPPSPPTSEDEVNDTNDEGSDTKENTDDSEEYTGSFDSLSLSGEEYM